MKKMIVFVLCVLLVAVVAVPAFAAEDTKVTVTASASKLERGDTVVFTVSVSGDVPFTSFMVDLNFNDTCFEYVDSEVNTDIGSAIPLEYSPTTPDFGLMFLSGEGTVNAWVQKITFKVKSTAPMGEVAITPVSPSTNEKTVNCEGTTVTVYCAHSYGNRTKVDDDQHQQVCSKCGDILKENHEWNEGLPSPAPGCESPGSTVYTCPTCGATKTEKEDPIGHSYDNGCDATCNRTGCGNTRVVSHSYATTYSSDKNGHWYACSVCGDKKDYAAHTPGAAATESSAQLCTVCNYEITPILPHEHDIGEDWVSDSEAHWHRCEKSGCKFVQDKAKHVYDDACDVSCSVCNYIRNDAPHNFRPELQANADGHWQVCASCGVKSEVLAHVPGPEATETEPQRCTECQFVIQMELSHEHVYGDAWYSDAECHWQSCESCTLATPTEDHVWDEGQEQEDGMVLYTCTVCARELSMDEPMSSEPESQPGTQPSTPAATQKPAQNEEKGGFAWQWAGIAAIVLMIVGVVLLIIEFIRSRKTNSHGRFSK